MKIEESKSNLVLVVEDIVIQQHQVAHAQRMILYPATHLGVHALQELTERAAHCNSCYHFVDSIRGVHKCKKGWDA